MPNIRPSRLKGLARGLILGTALHWVVWCGALHQTTLKDDRARKNKIIAPKDFDLEGRLSKANKLLVNFPGAEQINQDLGKDVVKSIDSYLTPDAKYLLVHVRQIHNVENLSEEKKEEVIVVQNDIYTFLDYLRKDPYIRLKEIYNEGARSKHTIKDCIDLHRTLDNIYKDVINRFEKKIRNPDQPTQEEKENLESLKKKRESLILQGAAIKLGADRKLKVLPAEKVLKDLSFYSIVDSRENIFLDIASKQKHPLVLVIFGGGHAWGGRSSCGSDYDLSGRLSDEDNIADYNEKNPDEKYSLIEVTVSSYK